MGELVNINIDGKALQVPAGLNAIEAAKLAGVEIPHFCYHPNLPIAGSCRMCLVSIGTPARDRATGELVKNPDGSQKIAFMPKLAIACGTKVSEGMHIVTNSPQVESARKGVLEFILVNHPLDCPICDKAGECKLQEYSQAFGSCQSRYVEEKNSKPKRVKIGGGKVVLDAERCILCSRCIRTCRELLGRDVLGFSKRGSKSEICVYGDDGRDSNYLVNIVDGCPVGALTESAFRFKMRTWRGHKHEGLVALEQNLQNYPARKPLCKRRLDDRLEQERARNSKFRNAPEIRHGRRHPVLDFVRGKQGGGNYFVEQKIRDCCKRAPFFGGAFYAKRARRYDRRESLRCLPSWRGRRHASFRRQNAEYARALHRGAFG